MIMTGAFMILTSAGVSGMLIIYDTLFQCWQRSDIFEFEIFALAHFGIPLYFVFFVLGISNRGRGHSLGKKRVWFWFGIASSLASP